MRAIQVPSGRSPWILTSIAVLFAIGLLPGGAAAQEGSPEENPIDIEWVRGPATGKLGSVATVEVPEGFVFAGAEDTRKLMEAMQNPTNGTELGFVAPVGENWFVVFEYDDSGYVKDDERAKLDADAILSSLQEGQRSANEVRKERGWETLDVVGWMQQPHYDPVSNNLEWAPRLRSSTGSENVNYNSRLLGRGGVMSATLVGSEEEVVAGMTSFKSILGGFGYVEGQRYAEFRSGDKLAKYGLTALITGGTAAVALQTGLLQKFWKLIVVGVAAAAGLVKKLFGGRKRADREGSATV